MKKIATWTALALATTLAGCTGAANGNRGLESVHQPVVRSTIYQFDVAAGSGDIAPSEQGRLQGWLDEIARDEGAKVAFNCFMDVVEYHVPKLQRTELTGKDGGAIEVKAQPQDERL